MAGRKGYKCPTLNAAQLAALAKARSKNRRPLTCVICGKSVIGVPCQKTCSKLCRRAFFRRKHAAAGDRRYAVDRSPRSCPNCGKTFSPHRGSQRRRFCSALCGKRWFYRSRGGAHSSRARRLGVAREAVDALKVFGRDGWRCQICGKSTPKNRRGTQYANAPELDHRIPLSKGGGHTYANVQCSCRACNQAKSNRNTCGQLPLFCRPGDLLAL